MKLPTNRYTQLIERVFFKYYQEGEIEIAFEREDIVRAARQLKIKLPKNIGDVIYSFRYRAAMPQSLQAKAPKGQEWIIRPKGRSSYAFVASVMTIITPNKAMVEIKIPDATPGVISKYSLTDEQSLLAKLRYNRLIDIFTGVTCYSLQSHLRTSVHKLGQVETDEIYIGLDRKGSHYVFPIQAKGSKDKVGIVQIEQDFELCEAKFPLLICRPIAAQLMQNEVIALFELEKTTKGIALSSEKHYHLVPAEEMTPEDLANYRQRSD